MRITDLLSKTFGTKSKASDLTSWQREELMWQNVGGSITYNEFKNGDYENSYSSINKIVQGFASTMPYAIDAKGKRVTKSNIVDNIYNPNNQMSAYDFREALMLMYMIWDVTYIRVHTNTDKKRGGKINPESITGFTFLENVAPTIVEGKKKFLLPGLELTEDEVLCINSANPYNLSGGFSPSRAARRWTRLDDYIADYQTGFFKNGAIPSGQFIITAPTIDEYQDIVTKMKSKHQGASKNNNVIYSYRPVDSTGKPQNAQIEWVPFNSQNKDMALKDIFDSVNQKVDSAYGVPSEIRGHLENSNYASVNVAEKVFVDYTLRPLAFKVWDKFTHELIRITGGFDAAITFDLPSPSVSDEEKVQAEAKGVDATTIQALTLAGYSLENIVEAFGFPDDYKKLGEAKIEDDGEDDQPDVGDPSENKNKPDQPVDNYQANKQITLSERDKFERDVSVIVRNQLNKQITPIIENVEDTLATKAFGDTSDDEDEEFALALTTALTPLVYIYGRSAQASGMAILVEHGLNTQAVTTFKLTPAQQKQYNKYLERIATGFNQQTADAIRATLENGISQGLSAAEIKDGLRQLIDDDYRVRRLAVTEVDRAQNRAGLSAMENIQDETGYTIVKVWKTTGPDPCPICLSLEGTETPVNDSFWSVGDSIIGTDGKEYTNTFVDADTADAHPNCYCIQEYEVK